MNNLLCRLVIDYNDKLLSKIREQNKLLQTQLDEVHRELVKYKVKNRYSFVSYRRQRLKTGIKRDNDCVT